MSFLKLVATIAAGLTVRMILAVLLAGPANELTGILIGGGLGIAFGLTVAGQMSGRWLDSIFPSGDEAEVRK